jgi:hypothetical protein
VDTPANQFANILSVEKVNGVDTLKGDSVDLEVENVFWDKENGLVTISQKDSEVSPIDGTPMQNIGFVEKSDLEKGNLIKFLVDSAKGINTIEINKENGNMTDIVNEVPAEDAENEAVEIAPEADAVTESAEADAPVEAVEKSADADEDDKPGSIVPEEADDAAGEEDPEEAKKSEEVSATAVTDLKDAVTSAFSEITAVIKSLSDEVAALKKSQELTNAKFEDAQNDFTNLGKSIDALQAETAFRKSGDLGEVVQESSEVTQKSLWGGRFLTTSELLK